MTIIRDGQSDRLSKLIHFHQKTHLHQDIDQLNQTESRKDLEGLVSAGFQNLETLRNQNHRFGSHCRRGLAFILVGGISGIWVILDYLEDEYVNKVPTAILATGFMLLGFGSLGIGILLNTISYRFRENMRQLHKIIRSR